MKNTRLISSIRILACLLLIGVVVGVPSIALAASKDYAVYCKSSKPVLRKNVLGCSTTPEVVQLEGVGKAKKPYPPGSGISLVTIDCSKGSPVDPKINERVQSFKCTKSGKANLKNLKTVQKPDADTASAHPSATAPDPSARDCNPDERVCAQCRANNAPGGSEDACDYCDAGGTCTDTASECSPDKCDLVARYVNPAIKVASALIGMIIAASLIVGGIQYSASGGDPQKAAQAKNRIVNTIMAFIAFIFLYAFLQFLVPGGIF